MKLNLVAGLRRWRSLVIIGTVASVAYGILALRSLPSGIYPEVEFPRIVCVARVGDLPPDVVQATVGRPLEEAIVTVPGAVRLRSRSIRGAVEMSAQFAPGTDMWRALQLVDAKVGEVRNELPADTELTIERVMPSALPIVTFNISGGDRRVMRDVGDLLLRPVLTRVPGVGSVEVQGGDVREMEIILRPDQLANAHLTPSEVADQVAAQYFVAGVGRVPDGHQILTVLAASEPLTRDELGALPIGRGPNGPILLSSVADVEEGHEDPRLTTTGKPGDVVVVGVSRAQGASAPTVADGAKQAVAALSAAKAFPPGIQVTTVYDQSELIRDAMIGVREAILIGIALALIVLTAFLRNVRAGAAAAIAVPITLIATFGVMRLLGQTLNLMSLGGLAVAIGLVVDDAIVVVEAIVRRIEDGVPSREAAERGTQDLFAAVVGTTFTTVVVFAPLAALEGVVGSFFGALAVTLSAAVLLSLIVSLTAVPLVASALLRPRPAGRAARPEREELGRYGRLVGWLVRWPVVGVAVVLLLALGGWLALGRTKTGFLPIMDEGVFVLDFSLPPGTSLEETDSIMRRVDGVLARNKYVVSFTRRTGAEMGPATATVQNTGDILVKLAPRSRRPSIFEIMDGVREAVNNEVPEVQIEFVQVLQDVLDDLSGNPSPIEVKVFGEDPHVLDQLGHAISEKLDGAPGLVDVSSGVSGDVPVFRADWHDALLVMLGKSARTAADDLEVTLAGRVAARLRAGDRMIGVRVRGPDDVRFNADAIGDLPLGYGAGAPIPVRTLATISKPAGPSELLRENLRRVLIVTAGVEGGDLGAATRTARARVATIQAPSGYQIEVGGQEESAAAARNGLLRVFALGSALVLAILVVQLRSLPLALIVVLCVPLALVGAVVTLMVTGVPLNASSMMGCVLLAGLVVKNGILLLEFAQREAAGGVPFREALARAGARRLRPILMTTAATLVGLAPLAFSIGTGSELQRPLAIATIGGLVVSTLVTLFVLPSLAAVVVRGHSPASNPPNPLRNSD